MLLILFIAQQKPSSRRAFWHPSAMQFYSGLPMQFLSGVDTVIYKIAADKRDYDKITPLRSRAAAAIN